MQKLAYEPFIRDQSLIKTIKSLFLEELCEKLSLIEVEAPMLTTSHSGLQDDLNGIEKPVRVESKALPDGVQVIHSLAKWKRQLLARADFKEGYGIVAQMKALRPDEESLSERHSIYVDQWDWEKVMSSEQKSIDFLKDTVTTIYHVIKSCEKQISRELSRDELLPEHITFIHSETLRQQYPHLSPKQREYQACKEYKAIFLMGIGGTLSDGSIHDGRAPDYDDWSTESEPGHKGLNGDILLWNPVLEDAFEVSSMGIRVCKDVMKKQLQERGLEHRLQYPWHQQLISDELPQTIGGGIGQSRLMMFLLQKPHIGQVQFSIWPEQQPVSLL